MKFESRSRIRWACSLLFALVLAGCGGGGGSTTSGDTPAGSAESTPRLTFTPTNMRLASSGVVGYGEVTLEFGQVAVDITRRYRDAGTQLSSTETCRNGGVANISLLDADGNGKASAGDTVTVNWRDCLVPMFAEVFSGTITIAVTAATPSSLKADIKFNQGLSLGGLTPDITAMFLGSLGIDWTTDDFRTTLNVKSTARDDFRFFAKGPARSATESFKSISFTKELRFDEARSVITMAMRYESEILGGAIVVSTSQSFLAYLNRYPETGRLELRGAGTGLVTVRANSGTENSAYISELDNEGDGIVESRTSDPWGASSVGYLWTDGPLSERGPKQPYTTEVFRPSDFTYYTDYIDAPGTNDAWLIQFSRPVVNGQNLQFRLRDTDDRGYLTDRPIPATVEARGARYLIRWLEPLKHNRTYWVEFSRDGVTWADSTSVNDRLGNSLAVTYIATLRTPDSMHAAITTNTGILGTSQATAQLDATASSSRKPIASYSWRQLNGTPLEFHDRSKPITTIRWGKSPPTKREEIIVELTITDVDGDVETAQTSIFIADTTVSGGKLIYIRSSPGERFGGGHTYLFSEETGSFSADPINGPNISYGYQSYGEAVRGAFAVEGHDWGFSFLTADRKPLQVGSYPNATRPDTTSQKNGLDVFSSWPSCNPTAGRYDVLDINTDAQGAISRLALEFEIQCSGSTGTSMVGSIRIKSQIPITR